MFIMIDKKILILTLISVASTIASIIQQHKTDRICKDTRSVLCVNHTLMAVGTVAKSIQQTADQIEKHIFRTNLVGATLSNAVNWTMNRTHLLNLPTSYYHELYCDSSNIDKIFLAQLVLEAHNAMSFYYNSIDDLLKMNKPYAPETDSMFKEIRSHLQHGIICPYRSVLDVYSYPWLTINQIGRLKLFSNLNLNASPSVIYDVRPIVISRLVRSWMEHLRSVIDRLDKKYH